MLCQASNPPPPLGRWPMASIKRCSRMPGTRSLLFKKLLHPILPYYSYFCSCFVGYAVLGDGILVFICVKKILC